MPVAARMAASAVFSSVAIEPIKSDPPVARVPLRVRVQVMRLRTVALGGGFQLDAIKTDVHGMASWENRNFLGGLRVFSAELKPGVVFYPTRINQFVAPTDGTATTAAAVDVRLTTEAGATVALQVGAYAAQALAAPSGEVIFPAVPLQLGSNLLRARAMAEAWDEHADACKMPMQLSA